MSFPSHVTRELTLGSTLRNGSRGGDVRRAQEWLTLHRFATAIDGAFGDATERSVRAFQTAKALPATGQVNQATWDVLVAPLQKALQPVKLGKGAGLQEAVLKVARQHLDQRPTEAGGDNRGPWVRLYMRGNQGPEWRWCAGFVTFLLRQACDALGEPMPVPGSDSCDSLAWQARDRGLFVPGKDVASGKASWGSLGQAQIFLVRKSASDWTHCGVSFKGSGTTFGTFEGNSNEAGSSNGFEACERSRTIDKKDFIRFN